MERSFEVPVDMMATTLWLSQKTEHDDYANDYPKHDTRQLWEITLYMQYQKLIMQKTNNVR